MSPDSQLSGHTVCKASSSISALGRVLGFSPEHPQVDKWYSIAIGRMFSMVFPKINTDLKRIWWSIWNLFQWSNDVTNLGWIFDPGSQPGRWLVANRSVRNIFIAVLITLVFSPSVRYHFPSEFWRSETLIELTFRVMGNHHPKRCNKNFFRANHSNLE